ITRYWIDSGTVRQMLSAHSTEDALWAFMMKVREKKWLAELGPSIRISKSWKLTDHILFPIAGTYCDCNHNILSSNSRRVQRWGQCVSRGFLGSVSERRRLGRATQSIGFA